MTPKAYLGGTELKRKLFDIHWVELNFVSLFWEVSHAVSLHGGV